MSRYHVRALAKIVVFVPTAVVAVFLAINVIGIVSTTPIARIAAHSLLSYWASIPAAVGLLAFRKRPSHSLAAFNSALLFPIIINIGSAISYLSGLLEVPTVKSLQNLTTDIYEFAVFGVLVAIALLLHKDEEKAELSQIKSIIIALASIMIPAVIYGVIWFLLIPVMTTEMLVYFGISTAISGVMFLLIAVFIMIRRRYSELSLDAGYFASACLLMASGMGFLVLDMLYLANYWIYAETLLIGSLFLIATSICVPYLRRIGYDRQAAYSLVLALIVLTYLPFTVTIAIEAAGFSFIVEPMNQMAFSIIHIGVGSLSLMMGVLLYTYSKRRPTRNFFPLILLFTLWAEVAVITVLTVIVPDFTPLGTPIVSYIVGSLMTLPLLFYAIRWSFLDIPEEKLGYPSLAWLIVGALVQFILLWAGETINQLVLQQYGWLEGSPLSNALLLVTNLLAIFSITYLLFIQSELSGGRTSIEVYVVLFLTMWIIPNVLKSYYAIWTAGWWSSEILVFLGLLVGPAFLGLLYNRAMREVEESHDKANLYADLLMHDVSNYHQMLLTSVELLSEDGSSPEQRDRLSSDAYHVISLAEQLITNVRLITESEKLSQTELEPMNLMDTLVEAMDQVMRVAGGKGIELQLLPFSAQAHVLGSDVLKHVFINIIHSVLLQPIQQQKIIVDIQSHTALGGDFWQVRLFIPGWWMDIQTETAPPRSDEDFSGSALGILVSRLVTESMGGSLTVVQKLEEPEMGTSYFIHLPIYQEPQ